MKYLRKFFQTFRMRLIIFSVLFSVPAVMLPTLINSQLYMNKMQRQNEETTLAGFAAAEAQIESLLKRAYVAAVSVKNYPEVDNYLFGSFSNDIERVEAKRDMINAIKTAFVSYDMLNAIVFIKNDGSMFGTSEPWTLFFEDSRHPFLDSDDYKKAVESNSTVTWLGGNKLMDFTNHSPVESSSSKDIMISGILKLTYDFSTKSQYDTVMVLFSLTESAIRACYANLSGGDSSVSLLNMNGAQLSGDDGFIFGNVPTYYNQIDSEKQYGSFTTFDGNSNYQVIYYKMSLTGYILVKTIPLSIYQSDHTYNRMMALNIGIFTLTVIILLYTIWASHFTRPFINMVHSLRRVRDGDLSVRMDENPSIQEFQVINRQFNQMLDGINTLIEQNQRIEHEKLVQELRSLQSQINPHFLYNTIASIRWMAIMSGASNISNMLIVLIELLRPVFSEWKLEWELERELKYVENYMTLMRLRYGTQFKFSVDVPSEMFSLIVPRFIIQPLLENCCEHGVIPGKTIHVSLSASKTEHVLSLCVHDDGRGISAERLAEIHGMLNDNTSPPTEAGHTNIGLVNVHHRIRLYCGEQYGLTIESAASQGTSVYINLPIRYPDCDK